VICGRLCHLNRSDSANFIGVNSRDISQVLGPNCLCIFDFHFFFFFTHSHTQPCSEVELESPVNGHGEGSKAFFFFLKPSAQNIIFDCY
jgi:hypothetical protein